MNWWARHNSTVFGIAFAAFVIGWTGDAFVRNDYRIWFTAIGYVGMLHMILGDRLLDRYLRVR